MHKIIFCLLLLSEGICNARKFKVGGGRGTSSARTNSGSYQPQSGGYHPAGGYRPQQGNYYPQSGGYHPPQSGYNPRQGGYQPQAGYQQPGGYHPNAFANQPKFNPGTGPGSRTSSTGTFKQALLGSALGAAGGIAAFELGKAILHSKSEPLQAPNGKSYYFDEQNHQRQAGYFTCSMPIDEVVKTLQESSTPKPSSGESENSTSMTPEQFFKTVQFKDGSRPKSLTWNCKAGTEICCGTECCPAPVLAASASSHSRGPSWIAIIFGVLVYWVAFSFYHAAVVVLPISYAVLHSTCVSHHVTLTTTHQLK